MLNVKLESVVKRLLKEGWQLRPSEYNTAMIFATKPGVEDSMTLYKSKHWQTGEEMCSLLQINNPHIPDNASPTFARTIKQALAMAR